MENTNSTEITLNEQNSNNIAAMFEKSSNLNTLEPVLKMEKAYIELPKPGDKFRGLFFGFGTMNVTDKTTGELREITTAEFIIEKQVKINAGVSLVKKFKEYNLAKGTAVEVEFTEKVKTKNGDVKEYSVTLLG